MKGGSKKKDEWEENIEKSPALPKLFTLVAKYKNK
jgi:hypothetical protein